MLTKNEKAKKKPLPADTSEDRATGGKSSATRQRILDAAAFVLSRKGFSGTRLSDIAKVAGMQTGSLYYHFSSGEELVLEVMTTGVNHTYNTVRERLDHLPAGTSMLERLRVAIEAHLLCLIENSTYARAVSKLSGQVPKQVQMAHMANEQAYGRFWKKLLRDARDAGEIRGDLNLSSVRMLMLGAMAWSVEWYKPENGPAADIARDFCEMVLFGLREKATT